MTRLRLLSSCLWLVCDLSVVVCSPLYSSVTCLWLVCSFSNDQWMYNFNTVATLYWNYTSAWVFSCKFAAFVQHTFLSGHLWKATSLFIVTPNLSFFGNCKMSKWIRISWDETQKVCYLAHLRPIFHLWRNQLSNFHQQNVWKTPAEEWNFMWRCRSMIRIFI